MTKVFHTLLFVLCVSLSFFSLCFVCTALETLVEKRVTGFPVIDDDWKLVIPYFLPVALLLPLDLCESDSLRSDFFFFFGKWLFWDYVLKSREKIWENMEIDFILFIYFWSVLLKWAGKKWFSKNHFQAGAYLFLFIIREAAHMVTEFVCVNIWIRLWLIKLKNLKHIDCWVYET